MITTILNSINSWITSTPLHLTEPAPNDTSHRLVNTAAKSQQRIGWDHLLRGRISIHWISAHDHYSKERANQTDPSIGGHLVCAFLDFSLTLWHSRNAVIHGLTAADQQSSNL